MIWQNISKSTKWLHNIVVLFLYQFISMYQILSQIHSLLQASFILNKTQTFWSGEWYTDKYILLQVFHINRYPQEEK